MISKKKFFTIKKKILKIYVCGITVYGYYHIGHLRIFIIFDIIMNFFQLYGYKITLINNITDIDNKIILNIKNIPNISIEKFTTQKIYELVLLLKKFNLLTKKLCIQPKVTNNIKEICLFIIKLIYKKKAYKTKNNNIYYNITKFNKYGQLSNFQIDNQINISKNKYFDKFNYLDFTLWKNKNKKKPYWSTILGIGRPGWHVECSALAWKYCGKKFDIHGGGKDLLFPHHENEIAQTQALTNEKICNFWIHCGLVTYKNTKISKTNNKYFILTELLQKYNTDMLKLSLMRTHYKRKLNYSFLTLANSQINMYNLHNIIKEQCITNILHKLNFVYLSFFYKKLNNNFNIPELLKITLSISKKLKLKKIRLKYFYSNLLFLYLKNLGLLHNLKKTKNLNKENQHIQKIRNMARFLQNYNLSDYIKKQLIFNNILTYDIKQKKLKL